MAERVRIPRGDLGAAAVALLAFLFQLLFFDRWFSAMDEGHMLYFAELVRTGGTLYRDAVSYPLPGSFYLLALIFSLFEPSILVSRWAVVAEFSLFCALVFVWIRRLLPTSWAWLGFVGLLLYRVWSFPHWQFFSYSTTALLFLVTAMGMLLRFLDGGARGWLLSSGVVFGVGVFCKQDYGAAALLAITATLALWARSSPAPTWPTFRRAYSAFLGPAALVGLAAAVHFAWQGVLGDVLRMTVVNHFVGIATFEYPSFPDLWPLLDQDPELRGRQGRELYMPAIAMTAGWPQLEQLSLYRETALYDLLLKSFFFGPYVFVPVAAVLTWIWWRRHPRSGACWAEVLLTSFAAALVLLISLNRPQDYLHLAVLYWPMLCLAFVHVARLGRRRPVLGGALRGAWIVALLGVALVSGYLLRELRHRYDTPLDLPRSGIRVKSGEAKVLEEVVDYVRSRTRPDEAVAVLPYFPILHFLAERRGPHRSAYILWPFPEFPDRDEQVVRAMESRGVRLVIYNHTQFLALPPVQAYAPGVFRYLVDRFETKQVFSHDFYGYSLAALEREHRCPSIGMPLRDPQRTRVYLDRLWRDPESVPEERRGEFVRFENWPFRPVVALRPAPVASRTVLGVEVVPPRGAVLRTAVGVSPDVWFVYPASWVSYRIEVVDGEQREVLYERKLDPHRVFADRGWFDVLLPLDRWAGRRVELRFSTEAEKPTGQRFEMGGFERPRLIPAGAPARCLRGRRHGSVAVAPPSP